MTRAFALIPLLAAMAAAPAFAADTAKPAAQAPAAQVPGCPGWQGATGGPQGQGMMHGSGGLGRPNMTPEQRQAMQTQHQAMMGGKGGSAVSPRSCPGMAQAPAAPAEAKPPAKDGAK